NKYLSSNFPQRKIMDNKNEPVITEFILQGFRGNPEMQLVLFTVFLLVYVITVLGDLGMILLICTKPQLHKPMYYFLGNLSFVDLCCSSTISPKMLIDFLVEGKRISFGACATQLFLIAIFADAGCVLLAMMAYDRYVAICNPLLYPALMSKQVCQQMIAISNVINHFFCHIPPLLMISYTYISELVILVRGGIIEVSSIAMILTSYVYILATILRMRSAEGRHKAFSTCASHLTAVGIYHGTILFMYFRSSSSYSRDQEKWDSLFYTIIVYMLNPLIYSLRNKEVKDAAAKSMGNMWIFKGNNPRYI
uniref:G-protein coupled receptors family 1 profile domain-containing protein n=1 Tax=Naja naja TaxID=35670 RepID=A0A8C6Y2S3_NAJNA